MKSSISLLFTSLSLIFLFVSCSHDKNFEKNLVETLEKKPELLMKVIEKNPELFMETVQKTAMAAKEKAAFKQQEAEAKKLEEAFDNPLVPKIRPDDIVRGTKDAPLVLVEYSDFECPFCSRGFETVKELLKKYEGKIQFVYKHLPLSFHKSAMISSLYYEAIRLQDHGKAIKFHDLIFDNQRQLSMGETFLEKMAKKSGADLTKLKKDLEKPELKARIEEDMKEAAQFGFQGTPGFLLNGIPVRGAYPSQHFDQIIRKLKDKGKIKISLNE